MEEGLEMGLDDFLGGGRGVELMEGRGNRGRESRDALTVLKATIVEEFLRWVKLVGSWLLCRYSMYGKA